MVLAIAGKHARVNVLNDDAPIPFTDEPMEVVADTDDKVWQIVDRSKKYWYRGTAITVTRNAATVDPQEYFVQHAGGLIHFHESQDSLDDITVTGEYVTVSAALGVDDYAFTISAEMVETTQFNVEDEAYEGYSTFVAGLGDISGSLSGFYVLNNLLQNRILTQDATIIEFSLPSDPDRHIFACYAFLEDKELASVVDGRVDTSVSFQGDGHLLVEDDGAIL